MNVPKLLALVLVSSATTFAADEPRIVPLWPNGAPGFEERRNEPETAFEGFPFGS